MALASAFAPDLFESVHHNADRAARAWADPNLPAGRQGPSYAAQDLFRALTHSPASRSEMIPGELLVVRTRWHPRCSPGSYLTYPPTEEKLRTPAARKLEAEVLYLGITRWFMRHAPGLVSFSALDATGRADTSFAATPRLVAQVDGAFDAATLRVDGASVPALVTGGHVEWPGVPPLAGGTHEASVSARFAGEGAARARRLRFHREAACARAARGAGRAARVRARRVRGARARARPR